MAVDGIGIDSSTRAAYYRGDYSEHAPSLSTVAYGQASLRYGMKGPAVEQLHQRLTGAGFPVSGDTFNAKTLDAVKKFQSSRGLDSTGVVGLHTMEAFESSFESFRRPPVSLSPPPPPAQPVTAPPRTQPQPSTAPAPVSPEQPEAARTQRRAPARRARPSSRRSAARRASSRRSRRTRRNTRRSPVQRRGRTPAAPGTSPATRPPTSAAPGTSPARTSGPATAAPQRTTPNARPDGQPGQYERLATQRLGAGFVTQAKQVAQRLGVTPEALFAMMHNESGLDPRAVNRGSGATGLIQFMPATARALGTSTAALRNMSATDQLKYVEKYFQPYKGRIHNATDLYIATFYPAALGKPDSWVMGGQNGTAGAVARANPIFDLNRNGQITVGEFREYYRRRFPNVA